MRVKTEFEIQELKDLLKGKTITDVTFGDEQKNRFNANKSLENDTGDIVITFTDGTFIVAWNSEWGGVVVGKVGGKG